VAYNVNFGLGFQRLIANNQQYMRAGDPVYLRLRNFPDVQNQTWAQLGFSISPTGTAQIGTTDILITPPPGVEMISLHNIGQSMGKLRFGARLFVISANFTDAQVKAQGLSDESLVWRGPNVVGLYCDNQLFSIENINHKEVAGKTVVWMLTCQSNEER
jgi:hypothetical protein